MEERPQLLAWQYPSRTELPAGVHEAVREIADARGSHERDREVEIVAKRRRERRHVPAETESDEPDRPVAPRAKPGEQRSEVVHGLAHRLGDLGGLRVGERLPREARVAGR